MESSLVVRSYLMMLYQKTRDLEVLVTYPSKYLDSILLAVYHFVCLFSRNLLISDLKLSDW